MKQLMRVITSEMLSSEMSVLRLQCARTLSTTDHHSRGKGIHRHRTPKKPIVRGPKPEEWVQSWYKWDYKPLPVRTSLDGDINPHFAVRPAEFKLRKKSGISRRELREKKAEILAARQDPMLEELSRNRKLMIDVDAVESEWCEEFGLQEITKLATFYGIDRDIFNDQKIPVQTWLDVSFNSLPIHRGNFLSAGHLVAPPTQVAYTPPQADHLTTLIVTNLDSHPLDATKEVLHWMVCNIPGSDVARGETLMEYLPPIAWKGTGHHRHVFALYSHAEPISMTPGQLGDAGTLGGRTFSSWDFTSSLGLKPVGLSWCQVAWDSSVGETCSLLQDVCDEPIFDLEPYDDPKVELNKLQIAEKELRYRDM